MVVQCGVEAPPGFDATSECQEAGGVGWYAPPEQYDDQSADVTAVAVSYTPYVELRLPGSYRPAGLAAALTDLAGLVREHLDRVKDCI